MKVKSNINKPEEFKPIELTITIESIEEFVELWHRMNIVHVSKAEYLGKTSMKKHDRGVFENYIHDDRLIMLTSIASDPIWSELYEIAHQLKIK